MGKGRYWPKINILARKSPTSTTGGEMDAWSVVHEAATFHTNESIVSSI